MRPDGSPVLTDFGLATALTDTSRSQQLTAENAIVGTADYLAPEQIDGRAVDGRADIYALGIVLYELVTGLVPFAGRDPVDILIAQRSEPLPALPATLPSVIHDIVDQATRKNPDQRFRSAEHMARVSSRALAAL
jgi:serine/threonine-protein kinase